MSLLSDIQGRPEGVHSLLQLLAAFGGRLPRDEITTWMMPASFRREEKSVSAVSQTIGCARSLGLAEDRGSDVCLAVDTVSHDPGGFADLVHARLRDAAADADRVMFLAYAYFILRTEQEQGTGWIDDRSVKEVAGQLNSVLQVAENSDEEGNFNSSKYPAWRAWMVTMGLGFEASTILPSFFPQPSERLGRELPALIAILGQGEEIPAFSFLEALAQRMPYLDGGHIYHEVAARMRWRPSGDALGIVLSEALRELHDEGRFELVMRGDAADAVSLAPDPIHKPSAFVGVVIHNGAV